MKIQKLIEIHNSSAKSKPGAEIFGHAYLLKNSEIYKNVFAQAHKRKYQLVPADIDYLSFALNALDRILKSKKIPYSPCLKSLREIETMSPGQFLIKELPMRLSSSHLHEAAHCLADAEFANLAAGRGKKEVLQILICESYANTVEAFFAGLAQEKKTREFIKFNSYISDSQTVSSLLNPVLKFLSMEQSFFFVWLSYLYSNFLYESVSAETITRVLHLVAKDLKPTRQQITASKKLFEYAFNLSPGFRAITTQFYFKSKGYKQPILKLLDFSFLDLIERDKQLKMRILNLSRVTINGL